ncbi:MAG: hypothetical protein KC493_18195 [Bacteriovoracaceae bacterium]|nr:hypothetical protein [Bacteriovoracaceae bacterium]
MKFIITFLFIFTLYILNHKYFYWPLETYQTEPIVFLILRIIFSIVLILMIKKLFTKEGNQSIVEQAGSIMQNIATIIAVPTCIIWIIITLVTGHFQSAFFFLY